MVYLEPLNNLKARCLANKNLKYCQTVVSTDLPKVVSYRKQCKLPVYDQLQNGTCTANTVCSHIKNLNLQEDPSRLFVYFTTKAQEQPNQQVTDEGADLNNSVISVLGVCDEMYMPYECDAKGKLINFGKHPPSISAYNNAKLHVYPKILQLTNHDLIGTMKTNLAMGYLIDTAVIMYPSFQNEQAAKTGIIPMPSRSELLVRPTSGHEVLCIGYDDNKKMFEMQNSWGEHWGDQGFIWIPYEYFGQNAINKWGDRHCMQILSLPIAMTDEKVPAISEQRLALTSFFTKHLNSLSDENISEMANEIEELSKNMNPKNTQKKRRKI